MANKNLNPLVYMVGKLTKRIWNKDTFLNLLIPFVIVFLFFSSFQFTHPENLIFNLEICCGIYIILTIWGFVGEIQGRNQHKKALNGNKLRQLVDLGLLVENIGEYWGYTGNINNYYFKIFYNWTTFLPRRSSSREICIMSYYSPPKTKENKFDIKLLNSLNSKYKNGWFSTNNYVIIFQSAHIEIHASYGWFTSFKLIKKRIDLALEILKRENLLPISEIDVKRLIKENAYKYGPYIETFWKSMEILK